MVEPTFTDFILFPAKTCATCGTLLPANTDFFARDKTQPNGLKVECRACNCARGRRRYADDPAYRERKKLAARQRRPDLARATAPLRR